MSPSETAIFSSLSNVVTTWRISSSLGRLGPLLSGISLEAKRAPGEIDVRILHEKLVGEMLGIGEEAVRDERHISYVRGIEPAILLR